ncbi:Caffeoyl-CoA O-methyltransferase 2 [Rhynchospora pubera]|uniref:Caffeoyl-CoA O-methyltransferase 2 n=1 Tax=Rhynchospora pubera TaxID=906938 RepID=A0AAV8G212_9POAL|nr:Caffeoyl-CoA O-methyltransferase 2 [Rhynchospora pubera]
MGCINSKLLAKSGSFSGKVNQTFQQRTSVLEELLISSSKGNNDQQFLALLCSTTTATSPKPNLKSDGSEPIQLTKDPNPITSPGQTSVETINTWELLAGLEEENEEKEKDNHEELQNAEIKAKEIADDNSKTVVSSKGRSFRTVEDLNAILASSESEDSNKSVSDDRSGCSDMSSSNNSSGAKRKARARALAELELPAFEFAKSGSLKEWLLKGGQIFSPGSYITPKFGVSVQNEGIVNGSKREELREGSVFDPELLAQFEEAIEEMKKEEESVLKGILERLEGNGEKEKLIMSLGREFIELNCQGNNGFGAEGVLV